MAKVHLDFGHGGKDPGALGNGMKEKDINLIVGLKVGQILERHKVIVTYSRTTDVFIDLTPRTTKSNKTKADIFVSIHCNAHNTDAKGLETLFNKGSVKGKALAQSIQNSLLQAKLYNVDRGLKERDNVTVLIKTIAPAALVEMAFITNTQDAQILKNKQNELAIAISKGILNYLNIKYIDDSNIVKLDFKGKKIELDGFMKDNINYVQVREVFETLGYKVDWDSINKVVIVK